MFWMCETCIDVCVFVYVKIDARDFMYRYARLCVCTDPLSFRTERAEVLRCMRVCICLCMCTHIACACPCVSTRVYVCLHMHVRVFKLVYACVCVVYAGS